MIHADRSAVIASLSAHGFLRRPRAGRAHHREWLHFCVRDGATELIVNLNIVGDGRVAAGERARVLVLARRDGVWSGDLEEIELGAIDARGGQLRAHVGRHVIELAGETVRLRGGSCDGTIAYDLKLAPRTFPSLARDVPLAGSAPVSWLVVPRLLATGTLVVAGRRSELAGALAYHDHNWGRFTHRDFTWQWGHAHAGDASVVLSRLLDRSQSTAYLQTLMLWRGARIARIFRGGELAIRPEGFLRPQTLFTLPRLATLLAGGATEVPRVLAIEAHADGDVLTGTFTAHDLARIVVPELDALRTTVIHEVAGELVLRGHVHGEPIVIAAPATFELLRSVQ
ncbi:MAG: hypothetical protein ABI867_06075 [Kofleriaceae bacterium]